MYYKASQGDLECPCASSSSVLIHNEFSLDCLLYHIQDTLHHHAPVVYHKNYTKTINTLPVWISHDFLVYILRQSSFSNYLKVIHRNTPFTFSKNTLIWKIGNCFEFVIRHPHLIKIVEASVFFVSVEFRFIVLRNDKLVFHQDCVILIPPIQHHHKLLGNKHDE